MNKKVLIVYYSFSSQTRNMLNGFSEGLCEAGVDVSWEQIKPVTKRKFPIGSYFGTFKAMVSTYFRTRVPIEPISPTCSNEWDLIVLGGPTWSFQPSGPILSLIDKERDNFFKDQKILAVISCRAYWKMHFNSIQKMLKKNIAEIYKPIVFVHTVDEPWCTIGLFLKLAGKVPESGKSWISKFYPKYGHTRDQVDAAKSLGRRVGVQLMSDKKINSLDYSVPIQVK